jgi:hypothetical protein
MDRYDIVNGRIVRREDGPFSKKEAQKQISRGRRRAKEQAMKDLGLIKVRGNLGGTYWE